MILHDQPTIFGDKIIAKVSSVDDGAMNFRGNDLDEIRSNRALFLDAADGIDVHGATLVQVTYEDTTNFTRYKVVSEENAGEGMMEPVSSLEADALVATRPNQALFLPLADCVGAIIYDPVNEILMVSHLGRHSIVQEGGRKSIEFLTEEFDSNPGELLVWLSPAAGKENYPLRDLRGKGLHEAVIEQMVQAGVQPSLLEVSHVDTADNPDYFSHSEYKKGEQSSDGRFAIVAMMVD